MTAGQLELEHGVYPILKLKAWNGRLMLLFLSLALKGLLETARMVSATSECLACFFDRAERAPRLLSDYQAREIHEACAGIPEALQAAPEAFN